MNIVVNGQKKVIQNSTTVQKLLQDLQIENKTMAVAINMQVIKQENWKNCIINDGDKIECLHFVGGG